MSNSTNIKPGVKIKPVEIVKPIQQPNTNSRLETLSDKKPYTQTKIKRNN